MEYTTNFQREVWAEYHSDTPESRAKRRQIQKEFWEDFPAGHRTSIRFQVAAQFAKLAAGETLHPFFADLEKVHPLARQIIIRHGKDYRPLSFAKDNPHEGEQQPIPHYCFQNAATLMAVVNLERPKKYRRITYVEGVISGPSSEAMLHAWNGVGFSGKALDWSFYARTMWNRYFGVPFTQGEYEFIINNAESDPGHFHMFFRRDHFESIRKPLMEVLKRPRTRLCKRNGSWEWTDHFQPV